MVKLLVFVYEFIELYNKWILFIFIFDDLEFDIEKWSIDGEDMVNLVDDENISDILNSDEEWVLRFSSGCLSFFCGLRNVGFWDEDDIFFLNEVDNSKMWKKFILELRVVNGDDYG